VPRHFPDWIAAYLSLVDGRTEAPPIYSYWSAVSTLAAALTRSVWIDEIRYKFYPNFLIVLAGRPGVVKKSTTVDECTNILRDIDPSLFGPNETTWPDLCQIFARSVRQRLIGPEHEDPLDNTYLPECVLTLTLREFGTFLKPNDQSMIEGLTDLWDAGDRVYLKSTKTSGQDHVQNPFLNIIGATTAKWLRDNFSKFTGWGIASRIIFVHSDEDPTPIWSPAELIRQDGLTKWHQKRGWLQEDLKHIMGLYGEFTFSSEAATAAKEWHEETMAFASIYTRKPEADAWVCDFLARKQAHVHKLAMVIAAARHDHLTITLTDFRDAVRAVDAVEKEIRRVFSLHLTPSLAASNERATFDYLFRELSNGLNRRTSRQHLLNLLSTYVDGNTAERVLSSFIKRGVLREEITPRGKFIILPNEETDESEVDSRERYKTH